MPDNPALTSERRQRFQIRFHKEGELRWIGHRDLVRSFERLFRRAGVTLRMSEGFHPKPRMNFPSALAVGIEARDEVLELELIAPPPAAELHTQLAQQAPAGLVIRSVKPIPAGQPKPKVRRMTYEFPVPGDRREQAQRAVTRLANQAELWVQREKMPQPINVREDLESVEWRGNIVQFRIRAAQRASLHPRDVLAELDLIELEQQGCFLTRTEVALTSPATENPN